MLSRFIFLVLVLVVISKVPILYAQDAFEPNNSLFEAKLISIGIPVQGTIDVNGDNDFFSFETEQDGVIDLHITSLATVPLSLTLYNEDQQSIGYGYSGANSPVFLSVVAKRGKYYVLARQHVYSTRSDTEIYTLSVELDVSDSQEVNNVLEDATPINPDEEILGSIGALGDVDIFQFQVTEPGELDIVVLDVAPDIQLNLELLGPTQQRIEYYIPCCNSGAALDLSYQLLETGTHYLKLWDYRSDNYDKRLYRLTISGQSLESAFRGQFGDVGNNALVDAGDASLVLQSVVGLTTLSSTQRIAADVDGNNQVQSADASLILRYIVGLISSFPGESGKQNYGDGQLALGSLKQEGNQWKVPLQVEQQDGEVYAAEAILELNSETVNLDFNPTLPDEWFFASRLSEDGVLHLAFAGSTPLGGEKLGEILLNPLKTQDTYLLSGSGVVNNGQAQTIEELTLRNVPAQFKLNQNYPNPFNPVTTISYDIAEPVYVYLEIFNGIGQKVAELVSKEQQAGSYEVNWDATGIPSGIYIYRLRAGSFAQHRILTVLK